MTSERRRTVGFVVAIAAHVEASMPDRFPDATIERLRLVARELLDSDGELGPEAYSVVRRIKESIEARSIDKPGSVELRDMLRELLP